MPIYRFRLFDKLDRSVAGQFSPHADDDAARKQANMLASRNHGRSIEIWCDQRQVHPALASLIPMGNLKG